MDFSARPRFCPHAAPWLAVALLTLGGSGIGAAPAARPQADATAGQRPPVSVGPDDYRGNILAARRGRVVLVNFWATWCIPCREELPELKQAFAEISGGKVAVVLVSLDSPKSGRSKVTAFLEKAGVDFPSYIAVADDPQHFIDAVDTSWSGALPHTLVYGREGKLVKRLPMKRGKAEFLEAMRSALEEGGPGGRSSGSAPQGPP